MQRENEVQAVQVLRSMVPATNNFMNLAKRPHGCAPPPLFTPDLFPPSTSSGDPRLLSSSSVLKGTYTAQPKAVLLEDSFGGKGLHLVATQDIEPGEVVFMDTSELTIPTDIATFLSSNAPQVSFAAQEAKKRHADLGAYYEEEEAALLADCAVVVRKAQVLYGGAMFSTRSLQTLLAVVLELGDTCLLWPPGRDKANLQQVYEEKERRRERLNQQKAAASGKSSSSAASSLRGVSAEIPSETAAPDPALQQFLVESQLRSDRNCRIIQGWMKDWCAHEEADPKARRERLRMADAVLTCFPKEFFAVGVDPLDLQQLQKKQRLKEIQRKQAEWRATDSLKPIAREGAGDSAVDEEQQGESPFDTLAAEDFEVRLKMGFLARAGLDTREALARLFAVLDCNSVEISVPSLPTRIGLFPVLRLMEHECRPSCVVGFLDCPATHSDDRVVIVDDVLVNPVDIYDSSSSSRSASKGLVKGRLQPKVSAGRGGNPQYTSRLCFGPSTAIITAVRAIKRGEPISISYIPSVVLTQPDRQKILLDQYRFVCTCRWCTTEPDLARAFRCPRCEKNMGVVCPVGDGSKYDLWCCLQCGFRPDMDYINHALDAEHELSLLKSVENSSKALFLLVGNEWVHYSHSLVYRKTDEWAEKAWRLQDPSLCLNFIETLMKCLDRILQPNDPTRAQYHEFQGQLQHALGNAHTAKAEYGSALQIREKAGQGLCYWTARTRFMAQDKSLANFMDSK